MKTFMGNWLRDNWGKLLLAVIGALVGIIAATIITGGAILAALPVIMKIVAAIFVGLAIMKAIEYLKTYLSEGWEKKVQPAARALANAVAVGIVELAMALGFRAIGVGLKAVGKQ
jgi:predicted lipid-binding transport protein (Tim44 family)